MRNLFLLFLAVTFASTTFAQKGWDISTGATVFAPIAKNINWNSKFWGQRVTFTKEKFNFTLGFMQNRAGNAQIPVLIGTERKLGKSFQVGLRSDMTFFNGKEGQFTYMPSLRYEVKKRWCLEQSLLRTVKDGKHSSQVGLAVLYHL